MTKKRQKTKPTAKAGATETPRQRPQTQRELHRALRRLEKLRLLGLEVQLKANLRRMKQSAETISLLGKYQAEMRPIVWEGLADWEKMLANNLKTAKARETIAQKEWRKWQKEPPQKRLKNLSEMIVAATIEAEGRPVFDARPWVQAFKDFPKQTDLEAFFARGKEFESEKQIGELQSAYLKAQKAFEELEGPLVKFRNAWANWKKQLESVEATGAAQVRLHANEKALEKAILEEIKEEPKQKGQKKPKKGKRRQNKSKQGKSPAIALDPKTESGKDL